ncbi:hypothetical protein HK103_000964 [Boothiomyces macroporosus]|uniref:PWI domain-containing protein n=1 Tax=Boothiomyces macroporosus TaxID=261099 RepID=A0AAD5UK72_9FUNG|nr:hypothetical protein HK103_000964 [Boothiomyces macroporosus]
MKLKSQVNFPKIFSEKVDIKKVQLDAMRPWIVENVNLILGFDDDICIEFIMSLLEEEPDPKEIQLKITGFLEDSTFGFMKKLWTLLVSAQSNPMGIPQEFMDKQKEEIRKQRERDIAIFEEIKRVREEEDAKKASKTDHPDTKERRSDRERRREREDKRERGYSRERREYGDRRDRESDREYRSEREYRSHRERGDRPSRHEEESGTGKIHPSRQSYHEPHRYRSRSPRERRRYRDNSPEPVYERREKPRWERPARE